jgi:PAS domain S-box-containing protein
MGTAYLTEFLYSGQEFTEIDQWRERILAKVLLVILVLGIITALPAIYFAVTKGPNLVVLINVTALGLVAILTFKQGIPVRVRATFLVALFYLVGTWYLATVGIVSQIYLLAFPILTALFIGLRPAFVALGLNAVTLGVLGFYANANLHLASVEQQPALKWLVIALNFTFVDAILTISAAILLQKLERSLEMQKVAARSIDLRQMELSRINAELAREVEVRKKAEEEKLQLARAVGQLREIILMTDPHGKIVYANRAFEVLSGRSLKSMSVLWLQQLRTIGDSGDSIAEIVKEQRAWSGLVEFTAADGGARKMETVISPSRDTTGEIENFVAVMRDSEVLQWT